MYLKELTLRGFKSFATATTLRFEPGITAVVGPNGSGKSNIVDALTWVMGEQGARNLRGSSMEDVIFAGTSTRPALGRAQVSLTIDNTDHALDIDYTEVTISRTLYRNGGSEYAINGSPCRLLDIQELLSDTGLGQQMHVIVGQGRLDSILHADPSGHRAFIEEAAGILKHRKRKERALRKLANTETNLHRLDDLLGEIRRQMGPLGRQARISRRADAIQITLRDARSRLYADDAVAAMHRLADVRAELTQVRGALSSARRELAQARIGIERAEEQTGRTSPAIDELNRSWGTLTQLKERLESLSVIAGERHDALMGSLADAPGEDPDVYERRAEELERQAAAHVSARDEARIALDQAIETRAGDEQRLAAVRRALAESRRTTQERDMRAAKLRERIAREESAVELGATRGRDLAAEHEALNRSRDEAAAKAARLKAESARLRVSDGTALEDARATLAQRRDVLESLTAERDGIRSRVVSLNAKADALEDTLHTRNASGALRDEADVQVLGALSDFIRVRDGWAETVAHTLGRYAGAIIVPDGESMVRALEHARDDRLGKAVVINAGLADGAPSAAHDSAEEGDRLAAYVEANPDAPDTVLARRVVAAVRDLLRDTIVTDSADEAQRVVVSGGHRRAVARTGEVFEAGFAASGGSSASQSDLSLAARRDEALRRSAALAERLHDLDARIGKARIALDEAAAMVDEQSRRHTEQQVLTEQTARSLAEAETLVRDIDSRIAQTVDRIARAEEERAAHVARLDELNASLTSLAQGRDGRADAAGLDEQERGLEASLATARDQEVAATIAWTEAKRKAESFGRQAAMLRDNARQTRERAARVAALNEERRSRAAKAGAVAESARDVAALAARAVERVERRRDELQSAASAHSETLKAMRARRDAVEPQVAELSAREHDLDVRRERADADRARIVDTVRDELGMTIDELIGEYGPDKPVPPVGGEGEPVPYVRAEQQKRLERARRDLAGLGKVNPLAIEEFEALETRNRYLNEQRDDVARSRDDLMRLIRDIDATMTDVFRTAFEDTAKAFETVFATLFPGGSGCLRLEDPDDMLSTGVIVEARPAGKRVRRLSLLSGGERSLTALALLFAIFTARPSPFYVMDEVEAALDDVNLTRLLDALDDLREHAQLIVITHQQRTMSIADALYGVTMRADGVTAVVSQKLVDEA
ncbi:chromosome segregation protein SMC [Bifidobacterium aesculapii]|uniref:chromosome segregation protein SMC n=1 Tax=Bifidobacterium aesculapii TaxID=1329411 RepID=UPI0006E1FB51|nr:chromosome segregation protein SMC [Bifidobacterium aesculapii]